jgi:hypothetical protein
VILLILEKRYHIQFHNTSLQYLIQMHICNFQRNEQGNIAYLECKYTSFRLAIPSAALEWKGFDCCELPIVVELFLFYIGNLV